MNADGAVVGAGRGDFVRVRLFFRKRLLYNEIGPKASTGTSRTVSLCSRQPGQGPRSRRRAYTGRYRRTATRTADADTPARLAWNSPDHAAPLGAVLGQSRRSLRSSRRSSRRPVRRLTPCATTATVPTAAAVRATGLGPTTPGRPIRRAARGMSDFSFCGC